MPLESKMKLRGEILSILNKYNTDDKISNRTVKNDINSFLKIEDKELLAKILLNEVIKGNKKYAKFCSLLILRVLNKEDIEKQSLKILEKEDISDEKKVFLLSILRQKEISFSPEEIENFIHDLDKTATDGIKKFLIDALESPEAQIDLLDFYQGITYQEKISLLNNLTYESNSKETINALCILSYLNLTKTEIKIISDNLLETNFEEAILGLENILKFDNLEEILIHKIKKKIKELKFKNPKYKNLSLIKDSKYHKSYVCFIDGNWNFSLIFSRINKDNTINTFFTTINIDLGITSVIGFSEIEKTNFREILQRLFVDSPPIEIEPRVLASLLDFYKAKNKRTNSLLPYEFYIWENLLSDIKRCETDVSLYINSKLTYVEIKENKLKNLFNSKILSTWFYTKNQSKKTEEIFSIPNKQNIQNPCKLEEDISKFTDNKIANDKDFVDSFKSKLLLQAYISKLAKLNAISDYLFSICYKTDYMKIFLNYIVQKSICHYLLNNVKSNNQTNVFKKTEKFDFTEKEINKVVEVFEKKWK